MLPTNRDFKRLTEYQKMFLLQGYLEQPTSEEIKYSYLSEVQSLVTAEDEIAFKDIGFATEQIEKVKDQLSKAGMI